MRQTYCWAWAAGWRRRGLCGRGGGGFPFQRGGSAGSSGEGDCGSGTGSGVQEREGAKPGFLPAQQAGFDPVLQGVFYICDRQAECGGQIVQGKRFPRMPQDPQQRFDLHGSRQLEMLIDQAGWYGANTAFQAPRFKEISIVCTSCKRETPMGFRFDPYFQKRCRAGNRASGSVQTFHAGSPRVCSFLLHIIPYFKNQRARRRDGKGFFEKVIDIGGDLSYNGFSQPGADSLSLVWAQCGCSSSVERHPCQGGGSEFEPRHPLHIVSSGNLLDAPAFRPVLCGCSSSGRAPPCQGGGSEFEPRHPLHRATRPFSAHAGRMRGCSSSGRAPPCQGGGSEFEPRHPLS